MQRPTIRAAEESFRIPMRDGVELVGDAYFPSYLQDFLPDVPGPFPTLVRMTPYTRQRRGLDDDVSYFVAHGYAVLIVSQRGRFGSGGVPQHNEGNLAANDGHDTIEWAASQEWSSGAIGTFGISSDGQWQLVAAPTRPPHLKAMFVSYPANAKDGRMEGGVHTSTGIGWHIMNDAFAGGLAFREDWDAWLEHWRKSKLPFLMSFVDPDLVESFLHPPHDPFWSEIDPSAGYENVEAPVLLECGWYDRYVRWTLQTFNELRAKGGSEEVRRSHKLIMGPWLHGGAVPAAPEPAHFPAQAKTNRRLLHLRWFDYWLRGIDTGIADEPAVRIYLMGDHRWLEEDDWPVRGTELRTYYLRLGKAKVGNSLNDGHLDLSPPNTVEAADHYMNDPYHPVPSIGGHGGVGRWWRGGPLDQRPAEAKSLTFSTEPIASDLRVIGEVRVNFYASSSAVDTDFILTLSDVYPNGYSAILRQTAVRARYRNRMQDALLTPGEVYSFEVTMSAIANTFKAGHKIRLSVASTSFPAFLPNPGSPELQHLARVAEVSENVLYHDSEHVSFIELPVVRAEFF